MLLALEVDTGVFIQKFVKVLIEIVTQLYPNFLGTAPGCFKMTDRLIEALAVALDALYKPVLNVLTPDTEARTQGESFKAAGGRISEFRIWVQPPMVEMHF